MSILNFLFGYLLGRSHSRNARPPEAVPQVTSEELFPLSAFELEEETFSYDSDMDPEQVAQLVDNLHRDPRLQEFMPSDSDGFESSFDYSGDAPADPYDASNDYSDSCGGGSFSADSGGE